jgi:hypothetical protein
MRTGRFQAWVRPPRKFLSAWARGAGNRSEAGKSFRRWEQIIPELGQIVLGAGKIVPRRKESSGWPAVRFQTGTGRFGPSLDGSGAGSPSGKAWLDGEEGDRDPSATSGSPRPARAAVFLGLRIHLAAAVCSPVQLTRGLRKPMRMTCASSGSIH